MKKSRQTIKYLVILLALCCIAVIPGRARVFFRWNSTSSIPSTIEGLGGKTAYSTGMDINGRPGIVSVTAFNMSIRQTVKELKTIFSFSEYSKTGPSSASALLEADKLTVRFIITQIKDKTIVFMIEQSNKDYAKSRTPSGHLMNEIPAYPQSYPVLYARDNGTGMSIASSSTSDSIGNIQQFYSNILSAEGWTQALPAEGTSRRSSMKTYIRNNEICCVHTASGSSSAESQILLLYKINRIK